MSILNSLKSALNKYSGELANTAAAKVKSAIASKTETITFDVLPTDLEAFKALPQADLKSPFSTAALTVLALSVWENDKETSKAMLNFLSGPEPISNYTCQMIDMSMRGKGYKPRSYFEGSRPDNNYTPSKPYTLKISTNPYSFQDEGYCKLWLQSGGADSPREIRFRQKKSTGQWFLVEQYLLSDIRIPVAEDKWA